jgi:hypothetical protein
MSLSEQEQGIVERLKVLQGRDLGEIGRRSDLGSSFHLEDAIPAAKRVQELFREVPAESYSYLSGQLRQSVNQAVEQFENELAALDEFDPAKVENPASVRESRIQSVRDGYERKFNQLHSVISYAASRRTDLSALDREARRNMEALAERVQSFEEGMERIKEEASSTLELVKKAAEEQGVSQQAIFFKAIADEEAKATERWLKITMFFGGAVTLLAIVGLFSQQIPGLRYTEDMPIAVYLAQKAVFFGVAIFGLYTCVRNYFAHKHNTAVNRQRHTALQTYRVLAEAARTDADRDVVLTQAAACIFHPQDTGFVRTSDHGFNGQSIIEILRSNGSPH